MNDTYFVFQPIVNAFDKSIFGYEALMRNRANIPITQIIDNCSTYDDFYKIERDTFFLATKAFRERGYEGHLFINSFPNIFLNEEDLFLFIKTNNDILENIVIEILENPSLDSIAHKKKILMSREFNSLLALDDFGTGNNGFNSIESVCPNIIKIDKSLVTDIPNNPTNQETISSLFQICKATNIKLLAEGVETEEEYNYFKNIGVDYIQGYYISKPF